MTGRYGMYRVDDYKFPAPESTAWQDQPLGAGLNGIPVLSSFKRHVWSWAMLDGEYAEQLFALFDAQQADNTPPSILETDPYDGSGAYSIYGTTTYNNITIVALSPRTRGLPNYDDVNVTFEVYVA